MENMDGGRVVTALSIAFILLMAIPLTLAQPRQQTSEQLIQEINNILDLLSSKGLDVDYFRQLLDHRTTSPQSSIDIPMLQSIVKRLEAVVKIAEEDPKTAQVILGLMQRVYLAKQGLTANVLASVLTEVSEQLLDQSLSVSLKTERDSLLYKAEILLEGVESVVSGKPVEIKVLRNVEWSEESEVRIASIPTSRETVRIYLSEERVNYSNNTVAVTKNAFINLGSTIIIKKETYTGLRPETSEKEVSLGENAEIGAILTLRRTGAGLQLDKTEYDVVVRDYSFDRNVVRLILSSPNGGGGKIVIIDVDKDFMRNYLPRDITVRVDGTPAALADSVTEVLKGISNEPKYFLAVTGRGLQIVLYIPSWSTKVVVIGSAASLTFQISIPGIVGREVEFLATTFSAVVLFAFAAASRLLGRRQPS